jgi:hypothetical protein
VPRRPPSCSPSWWTSRSTRRCSGAGWCWRSPASSAAGLVGGQLLFLWLAFGSLDFLAGQVIGKAWMVLAALPVIAWLKRRDARMGLA